MLTQRQEDQSDDARIEGLLAQWRAELAKIVERYKVACEAECEPIVRAIVQLEKTRTRSVIVAGHEFRHLASRL